MSYPKREGELSGGNCPGEMSGRNCPGGIVLHSYIVACLSLF